MGWYFLLSAGALGVEPSSGVLETLILPMNYAPESCCKQHSLKHNTFFRGICQEKLTVNFLVIFSEPPDIIRISGGFIKAVCAFSKTGGNQNGIAAPVFHSQGIQMFQYPSPNAHAAAVLPDHDIFHYQKGRVRGGTDKTHGGAQDKVLLFGSQIGRAHV